MSCSKARWPQRIFCRFHRGLAGAWLAMLVGWILNAFPDQAWAEGTSGIQGPHGDTIPSLLVILLVVAGLILLVRSSGRHAESKLEKLDEDDV